ncbi:hypothetical protein [Yersinia enterocolitica]
MISPCNVLVKVSEHICVYRGFSIIRLKRNKITLMTRYQVSQSNQSYGKFDAQAQATAYIDQLHQMRNCPPYGIIRLIPLGRRYCRCKSLPEPLNSQRSK